MQRVSSLGDLNPSTKVPNEAGTASLKGKE